MDTLREPYVPWKLPLRTAIERHRLAGASVIVVMILVWVKVVPVLDAVYPTVLIPLVLLFAALAWLAPPVAASLFFLSNYYLGNLSILYYPQVSFLAVLTVVMVGTLTVRRWKHGELRRFFRLTRRTKLALAALALFFLIGYLRAVWHLHQIEIEQASPYGLSQIFQASLRGSNELSHYMFLSHWIGFLVVGALACASYGEFRIFFLSFSILFVVQLLSIPLSYYPEYLRAVFVECQPLGLGYAQVNRAYLGYMAALAGSLALAVSHERQGLYRIALRSWWVFLSLVVVFSGSRGPVVAWILASLYVILRGWSVARKSYLVLFAIGVPVFAVSAVFDVPVFPCGATSKLKQARYSLEARNAHIRDMLAPYFGWRTTSIISLPSGESVPMNAGDVVRYKAGEREFFQADRVAIRAKPSFTPAGPVTWLLGSGFGGSQRSIEAEYGQMRLHSGSLNLFLDLFIETGLVGVSLFGFSVMMLWTGSRCSVSSYPLDAKRLLFTGLTLIMIVLLVKTSVAADTLGEDLAGLAIGLLLGAIGVATEARCCGDQETLFEPNV